MQAIRIKLNKIKKLIRHKVNFKNKIQLKIAFNNQHLKKEKQKIPRLIKTQNF